VKPTIAVITCYFDPRYVRGQVIRSALAGVDDLEVIDVINTRTGLVRYAQITWRLLRMRRRTRPDAYLLTFRGQEILPLVLALAGRRPVIFDEFIVPIAYATGESHRRSAAIIVKHALARISAPLYARWLRRCRLILADTTRHAALSSEVSGVPRSHYRVLPVGADESVFSPAALPPRDSRGDVFTVLYYGNMLPLHGLDVVLAAAEALRDRADIRFALIGGGEPTAEAIAASSARGARIESVPWLPLDELPTRIAAAGVCLGGPFGGTPQGMNVVTGKTYQFLACAAPVIVGRNDVADEVFTDGDDALLVPQGDSQALADAIEWAADHPTELGRIAKAGRRLYDKRFSSRRLGEDLAVWVREAMEFAR
jgi:glycosyltransferase involved in cell wall biosynthesis